MSRTIADKAVERIRLRLSEIRQSYEMADSIETFRQEVKEYSRDEEWMSTEEAEEEILQRWLEAREIEALEWVIREIFEAVP